MDLGRRGLSTVLAIDDDGETLAEKKAARGLVLARIAHVKLVERVMEIEFQHAYLAGAAKGETPEEHFGFAARDVARIERCERGGFVFHLFNQSIH